MDNRLIVVAEALAKPGRESELKKQLMALVEPTRKEEGCIQYDLHVSTEDAARYFFYEIWTSKAALDRHMQTPHFKKFVDVAGELLAQPARITTCTRIV